MGVALALARTAKGRTFPNPAVGAVLVKGTKVIASGATQPCGGAHAEVQALRRAGGMARGAVMYVTLEPCCHYGRTPPCTDAIISSGVRRVILACTDPNPLVSGRGIRKLRNSGIPVATGLMRDEASRINEDYFWSIRRRRAWITLKLALTLDGKIADASRNSRWITNRRARTFVHELRRMHAAIAVGRGTLAADNPKLTVRHVAGISPARFVFSSTPRAGADSHFRRAAKKGRSILVCPGKTEGLKTVGPDGVEVWYTGRARAPLNLHVFARMAYDEGLTSVLVEGGARLASSLVEAGMVNRLYLFYGNRLLGSGLDGVMLDKKIPLSKALRLENPSLHSFGDSWVVTGILRRK